MVDNLFGDIDLLQLITIQDEINAHKSTMVHLSIH